MLASRSRDTGCAVPSDLLGDRLDRGAALPVGLRGGVFDGQGVLSAHRRREDPGGAPDGLVSGGSTVRCHPTTLPPDGRAHTPGGPVRAGDCAAVAQQTPLARDCTALYPTLATANE